MKDIFSSNQYKKLVKCLRISKWIAEVGNDYGAEGEEFEEFYKDIKEVISSIEAYAKEMGQAELTDENSDEYHLMMETSAEIMYEYEEASFYDKLVHKLIERDCIRKYGEDFFSKDPMQRLDMMMEFAKKYEDDIFENGVDNLEIVKE
jgi:hypothetical protein